MGETALDIAIEPRHSSDRDRLSQALARVADDDPGCRVRIDAVARPYFPARMSTTSRT